MTDETTPASTPHAGGSATGLPPDLPPDLPAVQPPSTGFFVQLFLLPALIVFGIMLVWFLFGKLAGSDRDIEEYVRIIGESRGDRWKAAHDLSHLLRNNSQYAKDVDLATLLTTKLEEALKEKNYQDEEHAKYVEFLVGALGNFAIPTGVPILRRAVAPEYPQRIRLAALLSIANLAHRVPDLQDPAAYRSVQEALKDEDVKVREMAALTLGFINDPRAVPALEIALNDAAPTVRYNAANSIAMLGSDKSLGTLAEMLDPEKLKERLFVQDEDGVRKPDEELAVVTMLTALKSLARLHEKNPKADLSPILESATKLSKHSNAVINTAANNLLQSLK